VWSAKTVLNAYEEFQPVMFAHFMNGYETLNTDKEVAFIKDNYPLAQNISVDYAILEKAQNVYVLPATFDWNDLGTWGSLYDKLPKDEQENAVVNATVYLENATNNIIRTEGKKLVVIDGLTDYIIVDKDDVLLIYPKNKEQDIKQIVSKLK
jgi:mannose-1-phosphate guanylyltransferase